MISPHVKKLNEACKECVAVKGKYGLTATGEHAHPIDTLRYVAWYVDPPLVKRAKSTDQRAAGSPLVYTLPGR